MVKFFSMKQGEKEAASVQGNLLRTEIGRIIGYLYLIFSFGILDVWLRVQTRWIGAYSIFELAPNLFTLGGRLF